MQVLFIRFKISELLLLLLLLFLVFLKSYKQVPKFAFVRVTLSGKS